MNNVLNRQCDISEIFNRIVIHNESPNGDLRDSEDLKARKLLYDEASQWENTLPPQALYEPHRKYLHSFLMYVASKLQIVSLNLLDSACLTRSFSGRFSISRSP